MLGIVANPASGKDVRRLVARASVFDNQEKQAIVRRALIGAATAGNLDVAYLNDAHGIVRNAISDTGLDAQALDTTRTTTALDTITAAPAMREQRCRAVITLGGDGTNRAFCLGWQDAPLVPISTGTNNVFPVLAEATVAGAAAGLVARGAIELAEVATRQKIVHVDIEGEREDLALIDVVLTRERFIGARALLNPEHLVTAVLTRADPAAVGITSIGGLVYPVSAHASEGLLLQFGDTGLRLEAPIAPGFYRQVTIADHCKIDMHQRIKVEGPGVLAFDGERDRTLKPGQGATLTLEPTGPWVINVPHALHMAAERGLFTR